MSFLLLTIFQYIITIQEANDNIFRTDPSETGHIFLSISDGRTPDMEALQQIKTVSGITKSLINNSLPCAVWIDQTAVAEDINTYLGGMDQIIAKKKYSPIERDGKYRIQSVIYGLEKDSFQDYCEKLGISPQPYFDDPTKALVYNYTKDPENSTRRNVLYRELLDIHEGEKITFTEKNADEIEGDFEFTLSAEKLVDELPIETLGLSNFTLAMVMPMDHVLKLGESCCERRQNSTHVISGIFWADSPDATPDYPTIKETTRQMDEAISSYYASGDYLLSDLTEKEEITQSAQNVMNLVITFLTGLLAVIGLSNVWASISGNLRQRRQEFAMLKSVGLSPRQLWELLLLEGLTLGLKPLLYSLPVQIAVLTAMLTLSEISLPEYLPFAPYSILIGYICLILLAIVGAYAVGGRRLLKENIIAMIKDDTL
jgi:ABC-type antimicrobial peptide transport system, permease component